MKKPKVSVLMPVFNAEKYLKEAINSILNQTYKNFEFIIINDASIDKTAKIINSFRDKRIKVITNYKNLGVTKSLNAGLKQIKGKYVARMDADDISEKNRLQKQVKFLDVHSDYVLVGSNCDWVDSKGKPVKGFNVSNSDIEIRIKMFIRNQFHHASVIFRKNAIQKSGGYRKIFNGAEDYELWFRLLKIGKGYNFPEKLIKRRVYKDAVSAKNHFKIETLALAVRLINVGGLWQKSKS